MDTVEVELRGTVKVPAKYAPLIQSFFAASPETFQEIANGIISTTRMAAAKAGCEVDELIEAAVKEAASNG
jgi:hypothetical protein